MFRRIFVDIETLPPDKDTSAANLPDEVSACSDEEFRRLALDGDYGRVLTVGVIVEHDDQVIHRGLLGRERQTMMFHLDEARTLRGFWKLLRGFNVSRDLVVGHNVFDFDLPFLYKRSVIQRVRPSVELPFTRYRSQPIFDTMHQWNKWSPRKFVSLDRLAKVLGLESSKGQGIDGSLVYDRFCEGCHQEIADYCMRDVELVRESYYRMSFAEQKPTIPPVAHEPLAQET
ncbi:MAG: ribonuclease H-like domain-containing protein [Acidobacteria bacterium]|nr:ribonuclease H-like domain-containing protein [Acidobacteriota bacterium]